MSRADQVLTEVVNLSSILKTLRKDADKIVKDADSKKFGVYGLEPKESKKVRVIHDGNMLQVYLPLPRGSIGSKIDPQGYQALKQAQDAVSKSYKTLFDKITRMIPNLEDSDFTIGNNAKASFFFISNALAESTNEKQMININVKGENGANLRSIIGGAPQNRHELVITQDGKEAHVVLGQAEVKQIIKHLKG